VYDNLREIHYNELLFLPRVAQIVKENYTNNENRSTEKYLKPLKNNRIQTFTIEWE
jgi:hypothetical protein